MNTYIALFMVALCSSLILTPIIRRLSVRFGWLDHPQDGRRVHHKALPRLGGIAIFVSVLVALSILPLLHNLVTQTLRANWTQLLMIFVPATLVLLCGLYDDLRGADARLKFVILSIAGALFYAMGGRIDALSIPFVGSVSLPPAASFLLTILWIVAITNALNLIDGIDGLAAGSALFAALVILIVSLMLDHPHITVVALALAGALIGFLRYNFNPATIFLGDTGSLFIGFTLAALSLQGAQKASTAVAIAIPLMALGLPVIDTGFALVRRFLSGRPVFQGDREHIHHMLLGRGWSQRRTVFVLYAVCAALGLMSLLFVNENGRLTGLLLLVVGSAIVLAVGRLRYHEVDEIKASLKRNLTERRKRAINHLRIRRASRAMSKADNLGDLFHAVQEMLNLGEFNYAIVQIGHDQHERNALALASENGAAASLGLKLCQGMISWSWAREDIEGTAVLGSGRFWTLRLPLATARGTWGYINLYREFESTALMLDINYICHIFQREMAQTAERVLNARVDHLPDAAPPMMSAASGD